MVNPAKVETVQKLREKFSRAKVLILTDFRGLTVEEMSELREELRKKNVEYRVVKNLLAKRALSENNQNTMDELLVGPTAIAFGYDDPVEPVKILVEFQKKQEKLRLKGGMMGDEMLDLNKLEEIAKLPTIKELHSRIIGSLQSPVFQLTWGLKSAILSLLLVIKAVGEKRNA